MPLPTAADLPHRYGYPSPSFLVVDPGKTTGLLHYSRRAGWGMVATVRGLDHLPLWLRDWVSLETVEFVVCEGFTLAGGKMGRNQAGSDMPSSQGIGMCRLACDWAGIPLYLAHKGCKTAGRKALDADGLERRKLAKNDHERDVIDIAGYVLRELKRSR